MSRAGNEGLSDAIMKSELDAMVAETKTERDRLFLRLLWETGARIQEAAQVRAADFRQDDLAVRLETLKRHRDKSGEKPKMFRWVVIKPELFEDIQSYMVAHGIVATKPLFAGRSKTGRVSIRQLRRIYCDCAERAGVMRESLRTHRYGPAWPHLTRHGNATHLLRNGVDVAIVQKRLGHSQIDNTLRYLEIVTKDQARAIEHVEM